jgi:hypothetical protein
MSHWSEYLQEIAFPLFRFIEVFKHPPQDLHSLNVTLVDNFFMLFLIGCVVRGVYDILTRVRQGDDDARTS